MFDAKKTAEELVKLGSSRGDGWLEIDGLVIYMGPLAKAKSLRAALLVPVAAALSQAYAEGVAGAAKAASGVSSVGYDGMCYYDLSSNPSPLKRKERTMPDPMTKEKLAELRKLAEAATPGPWRLAGKGESAYIQQTNHVTRDVWTIPHCAEDMPYIAAVNPQAILSLLDALDAAEAEAGRLREVVGKLPVTADGVPVTPGMKVFWVSEDPRSIAGIMVEYITDADAYWRDRGEEMGIPLEWAMSTEAAARAAQGTSDAGKGETK